MNEQTQESTDFTVIQAGRERQFVEDDVVHQWYRFVLAYPDHLVTDMLDRFSVVRGDLVLDPFCGTGTTLVECKKLGIRAAGIDANPASALATRVKTTWDLEPNRVRELADELVDEVRPTSEILMLSDKPLFADKAATTRIKGELRETSREAQYLLESGMIERGWIDEIPFYISVALLSAIMESNVDTRYRDLFRLLLASSMVDEVANVRFGPEIYVSRGTGNYDVLSVFVDKVNQAVTDLETVADLEVVGETNVFLGDSRKCASVLRDHDIGSVDYVITSPPYPTEKDYTRNTRLELAYLGFVYDRKSLRRIKKDMVRSHSKGVYVADDDGRFVADIPEIKALADELREKVKEKTYGFAKLYPRIIEEYFGGMYRHLRSLAQIMRPGGKAAYVVGEQRTYLQTFTPTGTILGQLAELPDIGFEVIDMPVWRVRRGTTGSGDDLKEEIVILEKR